MSNDIFTIVYFFKMQLHHNLACSDKIKCSNSLPFEMAVLCFCMSSLLLKTLVYEPLEFFAFALIILAIYITTNK